MANPIHISYEELREQIPIQEVRAQFDWNALAHGMESGAATVSVDSAPEWDLETLYAPWYKNEVGKSVPYDAVGARPWRYDELIAARPKQLLDYLPAEERQFYGEMILRNAKVLTLDVGANEHLVLDGNHRLMLQLGHLASCEIALPWYRIRCSPELSLVPDTIHWTKAKQSF